MSDDMKNCSHVASPGDVIEIPVSTAAVSLNDGRTTMATIVTVLSTGAGACVPCGRVCR
jgi:hypothetical protein